MSTSVSTTISARDLAKRFGDVRAVDGVSFEVPAGSVLGLLGPNGAGKTTLVKMLTTLLPIDGGRATVGGFDVRTDPASVRRVIGLAGQAAAVDEKLTAVENLDLFARLYKLPRSRRRQVVADLVDRFDMADFANRPASTCSGGQRRRLDVAAALVAEPAALFLDEPTTGLDPTSRAELWRTVRELRSAGTAIVLTTQYLEEADQLADRIVVIDRGLTLADGTAAELKAAVGQDVLEIHVAPADLESGLAVLDGAVPLAAGVGAIEVPIASGAAESLPLLRALQDAGVVIRDFRLRRPTLDDVFRTLTGKQEACA